MSFLRPRSLTGLMLLGFALVSVPLLIAVVTATAKVRRLADESTALVHIGVANTDSANQLVQQIKSMERSIRLYTVIKDSTYLTGYREARDRFLQILGQFDRADSDANRSAHIATLTLLQGQL